MTIQRDKLQRKTILKEAFKEAFKKRRSIGPES